MPRKKSEVRGQRSEVSRRGKRRRVEEEKGSGSESNSASPFSRPAAVPSSRLDSSPRATSKRASEHARPSKRAAASRALSVGGARRAAPRAGVGAKALGVARLGELPPSDVLLISTPDDAIEETANHIAALPDARARVALHTSGALSSDVLAAMRGRGYAVGSMHPLAAVSDAEAGAESLRRAFYCVEGDARAVRAARHIVRDLGGRGFLIRPG